MPGTSERGAAPMRQNYEIKLSRKDAMTRTAIPMKTIWEIVSRCFLFFLRLIETPP
jgi:hypothetical protein